MAGWIWAARAGNWCRVDRPAPHEELQRGRPSAAARPMTRSTTRRPASSTPTPGTVLRSRDVELAFLGLVPQKFTATQLLYRTTDMNGEPEATVTTVIVPAERASGAGPCPVVSYQCAIDAVTSRCFPSYALRRRAKALGALAQFEFLLDRRGAGRGLGGVGARPRGTETGCGAHPYEPGYHVLDGLRAALSYRAARPVADAPIGLWGYSGGGLATAWAAEMSGEYAPELNIVGAVLGSPVGDLGHTFRRLNGSFYSGLPAMVVAALSHVYPELDRIIQRARHRRGQGDAAADREDDHSPRRAAADRHGHGQAGRPAVGARSCDTPEVQHVFDSIKLGTAVPTPPVLIVQAVHDRIVSVDDIDELTETYRAGGANVTYHRDMFSEHMLLHPMSAPMTLRWLSDRFAGKPLREHLVRTTWPTLLNPMTYRGMARLAVITAKVMTGRTVERRPL